MRNPLPALRRNLPLVIGGSALALSLGLPTASAAGVNVPGYHTVTNSKIAPYAVSNSKLRYHSISDSKIDFDSVGWPKLSQYTRDKINGLAKQGYKSFAIDPETGHLHAIDNAGNDHDLGQVVGKDGADGADGATGAQGPEGPAGPAGKDGADGKDGKNGVSGYEVVGRGSDAVTVHPADGTVTIETKCASDNSGSDQQAEVAIGGGASGGPHVTLHASQPSGVKKVSDPTGNDPAGRWAATSWTVKVSTDQDVTVQPYVLCATMG